MQRFYMFVLAAVFLCASSVMMAQSGKTEIVKKIPTAAQMLNNSAQGREYWIAIPPNEWDGPYQSRELELYVTASKDTKVTLEYPGTGFQVTKSVKAMQITTFTTADESANWSWEVREDEKPANMGIHLTADQPISVYVLNAKQVTSDGYLALPTSVWDKEYIHCSFYDFHEIQDWAGGFIVLAKENGTVVNISLDGVNYGGNLGRTRRNKQLGQKISVPLQKGQIYMVRGNGKTMGLFDLTGSRITANKPVGLISFHQRTMLPAFPSPNNGRDHLCEMLPPVSTWGKQYVSIEMDRPNNKGDMFRVVAKEANTRFKCRYTDLVTRETFTWEGVLKEAGDFAEKENSWPPSISIRGMAVWTADKPILVMQYSYSAYWNNDPILDPAMCLVVPVEQYTLSTVFQTPSNAAYVNNYVNLLAIGDSTDPTQEKLQTITLEGSSGGKFKIADQFPLFLVNRLPGTNVYWARLKLPVDAYHIYGETPFGATMYGFNSFESYYWPAATALNKLDVLDTLKPELTLENKCGDYTITATEKRDQAPNAAGDSTQIDTGVNQVEIDGDLSYNYELELTDLKGDSKDIHIEPRRETFSFKLTVKDKTKDAFAIFYVTDRAGNTAIDSVRYIAELIAMKPDSVLFGKVRVGTSKALTAKLVNPTTRDIEVTDVSLKKKNNSMFKILSPSTFPFTMPANSELDITFEYTPTKEIKKDTDFDIDSVVSKATCGEYTLGWLRGQGVMPHIVVNDWNAGKIQAGTSNCNDDEPNSLLIKNTGTDVLTITEIKDVAAPFALDQSTMTPQLPIVIEAGGSVVLKTICYRPDKAGRNELDVTFVSDADPTDPSNDNVSKWTGEAENPGPSITDVSFHLRVNAGEEKTVTLTNTGSFTLNVEGFKVRYSDPDARDYISIKEVRYNGQKVTYTMFPNDSARFGSGSSLEQHQLYSGGGTSIDFTVYYNPQKEATAAQPFVMEVIPFYSNFNADNVTPGKATGTAYLPQMTVIGAEFAPIKQGTASSENKWVSIINDSKTSDLYVEKVEFETDAALTPNHTETFPRYVAIGDTLNLKVEFTADASAQSYDGVDTYTIDVDVYADTLRGQPDRPYSDSVASRTVQVIGHDFTEGEPTIAIGSVDFTTLICDAPTGQFTVRNDGSRELVVTGFSFTGDTDVFEVYDVLTGAKVDENFAFTVAANENSNENSRAFRVIFTPKNAATSKPLYTMDVIVNSNAAPGGDNIAEITGRGYTVPVTFSLSNGTAEYIPGDKVPVDIRATSEKMNEVKLNTFTMVVAYDAEALRYNDNFTRTAGLNGWNITVEADKPARGQITITGDKASGTDFVQEGPNGEFLTLEFRVFLSAKTQLPVTLSVLREDLGDRAVCVVPQTENSVINLGELCVRELRTIRYTGEAFALRQNAPNPAGNNTEIEYSVAFEVPVKLAVYNMMGEEVKVLVEGIREAGVYKVRLLQDELPSGTYIYRLTAGPYTESKQMVITR